MIIKVMDKQDVEGESLDELMEAIEKVSKVKQALSAVEAEGLYPAYIPTCTL